MQAFCWQPDATAAQSNLVVRPAKGGLVGRTFTAVLPGLTRQLLQHVVCHRTLRDRNVYPFFPVTYVSHEERLDRKSMPHPQSMGLALQLRMYQIGDAM